MIEAIMPAMAICVYHKEHLWTLPLAVHDLHQDYSFYFRPYGFIWDEVRYAVPYGGRHGIH